MISPKINKLKKELNYRMEIKVQESLNYHMRKETKKNFNKKTDKQINRSYNLSFIENVVLVWGPKVSILNVISVTYWVTLRKITKSPNVASSFGK